jgi:hypothetical protein
VAATWGHSIFFLFLKYNETPIDMNRRSLLVSNFVIHGRFIFINTDSVRFCVYVHQGDNFLALQWPCIQTIHGGKLMIVWEIVFVHAYEESGKFHVI